MIIQEKQEDIATGSAAGAVAAWLYIQTKTNNPGIQQGTFLDPGGEMQTEVIEHHESLTVKVSGFVCFIGKGAIYKKVLID